jgi:hypothetical protein
MNLSLEAPAVHRIERRQKGPTENNAPRRRDSAQRGPLPQPNTPQLENREFYRDGQDEQDKSLNASLILFILSIPVKFLLLELSAHNLASKTRNLRISMKKNRKESCWTSFGLSSRLRAFAFNNRLASGDV